MTSQTLSRTVAVGAITGMRSMSGLAVLSWRHGGPLAGLAALMALGEMIADKLPGIGDRTEPLPLTGRMVLGGCAGSYIAHRGRSHAMTGFVLGAASALITAHLATQARKELKMPGLFEDALTLTLGSHLAHPNGY